MQGSPSFSFLIHAAILGGTIAEEGIAPAPREEVKNREKEREKAEDLETLHTERGKEKKIIQSSYFRMVYFEFRPGWLDDIQIRL